jgi:hypothetical protein
VNRFAVFLYPPQADVSWMKLRIMSHISIRINEMHKSIVGFDDSKLRREEELEALPREMVWMRPLAAQHVTISKLYKQEFKFSLGDIDSALEKESIINNLVFE